MIWQLIDSSGVGGAERHAATLAASLSRRGVPAKVVLYQRHGDNPWLRQLADAGITTDVLDGTPGGLLGAIRRDRPALVHTHGYKAGLIGRVAARLAGVPAVSTFHSGSRGRMPVRAYELLDEWTSFLGGRIAVSGPIARRLPFRSVVIPSYLTVPPDVPEEPLPRAVGFLGRLSEEKAPDLFCALAARCADIGLGWHVFGDGPMRASLETRFGDAVTFHGVVTDVSAVWRTVGLLSMPSRAEGVPLAALEAMAAGVPVLASRVGGLPSAVQDGVTGWLHPMGDLSEAEGAVRVWAALGPEAQATLRRACRDHAAEAFGEDTQFPRILEVYRACGLALPG